MTSPSTSNASQEWTLQKPPPLPEGYAKHHIVFLEAVHLPLAELPFEHTIDIYQRTFPSEIAERIKDATIVISNVIDVKHTDMDHAPHLRLIAILATGMGWVDKDYCCRRGISVVNTPSANIDAVSEHFLGLYFASRKRIPQVDRTLKETDQWTRTNTVAPTMWPDGFPLGCKQETLGIVGYGALGKRIEMLCQGLGFADILIAERRGAQQIREGRTAFEEVVKRCTTLVLVCPRESDTINLIGEKELEMMKKEALVINMARGGIVNEAALAKTLKERRIFGAATDVFDQEPVAPGGTPLLPDLSKGEEPVPNLIVSGHVAWYSGTTVQNLQALNRDAMTAFVEGKMYDPKVRACVAIHDGKVWK